MKNLIPLACIAGCCVSASAQSSPPPGAISRSADRTDAPAQNGRLQNLTFTNTAGESFTVDQLASQLQRLRSTVDEVLPTLSAFTQTFSNSVSGGQQTLGGTLSGLLSGIFNRNTNSASNAQSGSGGIHASNLLAVLQSVISNRSGTNTVSAAPLPPDLTATYEQIATLQTNLEPIPGILQSLSIAGIPSNKPLSPAGRESGYRSDSSSADRSNNSRDR